MAVKHRNRKITKIDIYAVDRYNLRRLTSKLTESSNPSYAATLHALICLACEQHGIDPLEDDVEDGTRDSRTYRRIQIRKRRILDVPGYARINLHPKL